MRLLLIFSLFFCNHLLGQQKEVYWDFEGSNPFRDKKSGIQLDSRNYKDTYLKKEKNNTYIYSNDGADLVRFPFNFTGTNVFRLKFSFAGNHFKFVSLPQQNIQVIFDYDYIEVNATVTSSGKEIKINHKIPLRGAGIENYAYWASDVEKVFDFCIDGQAGQISIFVDDQTSDKFSIKIPKFSSFKNHTEITFRFDGLIDNVSISDQKKSQVAGRSNVQRRSLTNSGLYNSKDFAPGYPNYNITAIQQLKQFPNPRFATHYEYKRNFPWFDITYLYKRYDYYSKAKSNRHLSAPAEAVDIMAELYNHWNYYYEVPTLRLPAAEANRQYNDLNNVYGQLMQYAKRNPRLKTSTILVQIQNRAQHAGFDLNGNYEASQNLPDKYYLKDANGKFVLQNNKKILSPVSDPDYKIKDAETSVYYLKALQKNLGRPIDFINENGEIFGHSVDLSIYNKDPKVAAFAKQMNFRDKHEISGYFQNKLDTIYKNTIIRELGWSKTQFSFYNVSAYNSNYWPAYKFRRTNNPVINNIHYSTPSFYPSKPYIWERAQGPLNGFYNIAEGRKREIEQGDILFSPFVSAGWGLEEDNIRPGQWLALLKSMLMLGAEYFYVGYFNVTGTTGWANGVGANDPSGYVYQIAMPAYTQALYPYIESFLKNGALLNKDGGVNVYRLKASKRYHLVMARKLNNKYLIYGSVQPNSNVANAVPEVEPTVIQLDNYEVKLNISRQGSMYILDLSKKNAPVVIQLDSWHEPWHPYFWSKDTKIEAELLNSPANELKSSGIIFTNNTIDFSGFISYLQLKNSITVPIYKNTVSEGAAYMKGKGKVRIGDSVIDVDSGDWKKFPFKINKDQLVNNELKISLVSGSVDIDYFIY